MKVELIYNENNKAIGWSIDASTEDEKSIVNTIRNLQFFGLDDTVIRYNGREGGDEKYAGKLKWCQKKHTK
jgi:hypothetical protein